MQWFVHERERRISQAPAVKFGRGMDLGMAQRTFGIAFVVVNHFEGHVGRKLVGCQR